LKLRKRLVEVRLIRTSKMIYMFIATEGIAVKTQTDRDFRK